jgi:hypothetical protein
MVVSTYYFWGCKDIRIQPNYKKIGEKTLENVEKKQRNRVFHRKLGPK